MEATIAMMKDFGWELTVETNRSCSFKKGDKTVILAYGITPKELSNWKGLLNTDDSNWNGIQNQENCGRNRIVAVMLPLNF